MANNVTGYADKPSVAAAGQLQPVRKVLTISKAMGNRQAIGNESVAIGNWHSVSGNRGLSRQ